MSDLTPAPPDGTISLPELPVVSALPEIRAALRPGATGSAVIVAPPGAGKTTLVPLALLDESWLEDRKILILEPRRLATRAAARRMASLLGEKEVGGTVGYRIRLDTRVGPHTRIEVITEGVLTRMLHSDPALRDVGLVIFDEFHERSLHADLGLALSLQSRELFRADLRVVVMSATIDPGPVAELLGDAPVVESQGRRFSVDTRWRDRRVEGWIEPPVTTAVLEALERDEGDILVFLPGAGEIRRTTDRLEEAGVPSDVTVHPLFGNLSRRDQDRALGPSPPGRRKVVLATSIAETSLTIEGVRVVVDSGLMRVPRFDPGSGMTRLETIRVTRDSADQRRGRAGRIAPGVCYRMWTEGEDRGLVPHRRPEILEADLAPLAVDLATWGATPDDLRWLDAPPASAYAQAIELLRALEVLDREGTVTEHGARVATLGLHPRLAHMLVRGTEAGWGVEACDLAALLGERDILTARGRAPDADLRLRMEAVAHARQRAGGGRTGRGETVRGGTGRGGTSRGRGVQAEDPGSRSTIRGQEVARGPLRQVLRESAQWRRTLGIAGVPDQRQPPSGERGEDDGGSGERGTHVAGVLAALAYPDRIGRRRGASRGRFLLRNGRGARFAEPQPLAGEEWLVAAEVEGKGTEARIFRAAPVGLADIERWFAEQIEDLEEVVWDPDANRVRARRRRVLGALVLSEAPLDEPQPRAIADALLEGVREVGLASLPWSRETDQLRARLQFLHWLSTDSASDAEGNVRGDAEEDAVANAKEASEAGASEAGPSETIWPDTSESTLVETMDTWLRPFLAGMKSLDDLKRLDLSAALMARAGWDVRDKLARLAPTHLEVPSGSRIPIDYSDPVAPALAVRLQEVFGLQTTPRIAAGRVPLVMRLLSPARRPVQVTTDLASFWRDAYFEVRKEMKGRYPRHYWPENPLEAEPTKRTKPRG